jgi:uncharacterized membrane protein
MKTIQLWQKHWTTLLGTIFLMAAMIYLFRYTVDLGLITNAVKISIGILSGCGLAVLGLTYTRKPSQTLLAEIIMGLGVGILYTTFSFAGIYYAFWDSMTILLGISAITIALTVYSFHRESRVLMNISLIGALMAPLLMQPTTDQAFVLFIYLLIINAAYFIVSIKKNWNELKTITFVGTWLLYGVYYILFNPVNDQIWSLPFRYLSAMFVYYLIAFMIASCRKKVTFDGLNLYLNLVNGVLFGLWSSIIFNGNLSFAYPLASMGLLYIFCALLIYRMQGRKSVALKCFAAGGMFLLLLALSQLGKGHMTKPLVDVYIWSAIAFMSLRIGQIKNILSLTILSLIIWIITGIYWFTVTWSTPRGEWFGLFIPFLNWGAVSWFVLAFLGYYYSMQLKFVKLDISTNRFLSNLMAILSHLIIAGLLSVQIGDAFNEYHWDQNVTLNLAYSVTWGVYAVMLFLWGAFSKQLLFRWFGSGVIGVVAIKAIFFDLSGEESLYKVLALLILGGLSFLISWINHKWQPNGTIE